MDLHFNMISKFDLDISLRNVNTLTHDAGIVHRACKQEVRLTTPCVVTCKLSTGIRVHVFRLM